MIGQHKIGIICRECEKQWRLEIKISGNPVEAFATLCECGSIIVGNYNYNTDLKLRQKIKIISPQTAKSEKYLTNGHFDILDISPDELEKLPELELE